MDVALVQYINRLCRHLAITPARLHPHEVYLDPADAADPRISCLLSMYRLERLQLLCNVLALCSYSYAVYGFVRKGTCWNC